MKLKVLYRCQECGAAAPKWAGQCPGCAAWNSLVEEAVEAAPAGSKRGGSPRPLIELSSEPAPLARAASGEEERRLPTGIGELDRLLGGGVVPGQVLLVAGPPGIGKSTFLLQVAGRLSPSGTVLYVSGEESSGQVASRAKRLGVEETGILLQSETDLGKVLAAVEAYAPRFLILDSISTVYHPDFTGSPGSVGQVRECAAELLRAAKRAGAVLFMLGHVTKDGSVAGPKVLEHIVDTVLQFDPEDQRMLRVLRSTKNRFGPTSELGIFEMGASGLKEVEGAAAFLIDDLSGSAPPGRAVSVALEGSRPILAEVQALVTPTRYPLPRRMATGIDLNRVLVLLAALEKHLKLRFESQDVFVNLAGGLRLRDPALDLAVCLALVSSQRNEALPADRVFLGEVGLLGRLGPVPSLEPRLSAARRAAFHSALVAGRGLAKASKAGAGRIAVDLAEDIASAVERSFPC